MTTDPTSSPRCPCRKVTDTIGYTQCCGPHHNGTAIPTTAVALMRSRYSAYAMNNADYVAATWHASTRPADLQMGDGQGWVMLKVHKAVETGDTATVAFTARLRKNGKTGAMSETSRFVREGGRWYYVDGVAE